MKSNVFILIIFFSLPVFAQPKASGLRVITNTDTLAQQIKANRAKKLIGLKSSIPGIKLDLKYAQADNFVQRQMYNPAPSETYLRRPAAKALKKVAKILRNKGYHLLVWDAYRPYSVTVDFWKLVGDERYVANPSRGSGHNKGLAVDLSLIDIHSQKAIDMGTGFDNFSDTAHHSFEKLSDEVIANRRLLRRTMEACGFKALETEWWHYYWPDDQGYEVLDIPFEALSKLID